MSGHVNAGDWHTYALVLRGFRAKPDTKFELRQCPQCSALVQPSNEGHHQSWHRSIGNGVPES